MSPTSYQTAPPRGKKPLKLGLRSICETWQQCNYRFLRKSSIVFRAPYETPVTPKPAMPVFKKPMPKNPHDAQKPAFSELVKVDFFLPPPLLLGFLLPSSPLPPPPPPLPILMGGVGGTAELLPLPPSPLIVLPPLAKLGWV